MSDPTTLLITGNTAIASVFNLPVGRLRIGQFVVLFSPEQVLSAATSIIEWFERAEGHEAEHLFVSQAGVIAYAAKEFGIGSLDVDTF